MYDTLKYIIKIPFKGGIKRSTFEFKENELLHHRVKTDETSTFSQINRKETFKIKNRPIFL